VVFRQSKSTSNKKSESKPKKQNQLKEIKMKKILVILFIVFAVLAGQSQDERDTFRAGQALARAFWHELFISLNYQNPDGSYHYMVATTDVHGSVDSVTLDGKVVISEEEGISLPGIPVPIGGMRNVAVYVDGVDTNEVPVVMGQGRFDLVDEKHPISIILRPTETTKFVAYDISGLDLPKDFDVYNLRLVLQDGTWVGYYQPWLGGFVMFVDPSGSPFYATISTENPQMRYDSILIDPLKQKTKSFQGSSINTQLIGGVHRFMFQNSTDGWYNDNMQSSLDGYIEKNGSKVKAKSFIFENTRGLSLALYVYGEVSSSTRMKMSAYFVYPDKVKLIGETTISPTYQNGRYEVSTPLRIYPKSTDPTSLMFVVEQVSGEPAQNLGFSLYNEYRDPFTGKLVIDEDGFVDEGSSANNDEGSSRDYVFSFEATVKDGDVKVFAKDIKTFVGGSGQYSSTRTVDSAAEETSSGVFVIMRGQTRKFTVVVTVYNVYISGQYRVGLDSVGAVDVDNTRFRTAYRTINQSSGGKG